MSVNIEAIKFESKLLKLPTISHGAIKYYFYISVYRYRFVVIFIWNNVIAVFFLFIHNFNRNQPIFFFVFFDPLQVGQMTVIFLKKIPIIL